MIISLDFESRSEIDLTVVGAWKYSKHPSTDILCLSYAVDDAPAVVYRTLFGGNRYQYPLEFADLLEDPDVKIKAFNANFECAMYSNICAERWNLPDLRPEQFICSAALAQTYSLPRSMGDVADALGLERRKDKEGYYCMMRMCKPVPENRQHLHGKWFESDEDFDTLMDYCQQDVEVERAIADRLGEMPDFEQRLFNIDMRINSHGVALDLDLAHSLHEAKEELCNKLSDDCQQTYGFRPSQVQKIKDYMKENGVAVPVKKKYKKMEDGSRKKVDVETIGGEYIKKLLVEDIPDSVKDVLRTRRDFATTSLAKAKAGINHIYDGRVHGQFVFHGANTGRWSGKGIQLHNLPRGNFDEDFVDDEMAVACDLISRGAYMEAARSLDMRPMDLLRSALRGMVVPSPRCELTVMDFSQIEARVLAWLAGQQDVLDTFAEGKDLYMYTASQIYEKLYDEVTKAERFIGKTASLALGYQGAHGAFQNMAANMGTKVDDDLARSIVADWRAKNDKIVSFWYTLQRAATRTVQTGKTTQVGPIKFAYREEFLKMKLPSGRCVNYYQPVVRRDEENGRLKLNYMGSDQQRSIKWGLIGTYGGKLAENVTQAVARDLLANAIVNLYDKGYNVVAHVHDEVILDGQGYDIEEVRSIMLDLPPWADGLPVDADGFQGMRYRK